MGICSVDESPSGDWLSFGAARPRLRSRVHELSSDACFVPKRGGGTPAWGANTQDQPTIPPVACSSSWHACCEECCSESKTVDIRECRGTTLTISGCSEPRFRQRVFHGHKKPQVCRRHEPGSQRVTHRDRSDTHSQRRDSLEGGVGQIPASGIADSIALKKGCAQCITSARALRARADSLAPNVDLVVVTPNSDNDARAFLEEHHIRADRIMSGVTVSTYKITQTPTLIHLDRQGNVVGIWSGIVDDERQKEVEKNFTGPIARR